MAVDYREVNQYLRVSAYQLPNLDMLFHLLRGRKIFLGNVGYAIGQNDQVQRQTQANHVLHWYDLSGILRTQL